MISLDSLLSRSALAPILSQYSDVLPQGNVDNEISTFKDLERNPQIETATDSTEYRRLHSLLESIDPVKQAIPILKECFTIAMTLGTSTATVERSFSSLHRLKPYLRTTMS